MDKNMEFVMEKKLERTMKALEKNNMNPHLVDSYEGIIKKIDEILEEGSVVSVGGSMTLFETGVIDHLRTDRYKFSDRYEKGLTSEGMKKIFREAFLADGYITSTNAITENGELYNVDGNGNRVAAMIYGPDKVIVITGTNKIVKNIDEAIARNREIAAPANAHRLSRKTPCVKVGYCMDCSSPERICQKYTVHKWQSNKDRIHVIFIDESLGY